MKFVNAVLVAVVLAISFVDLSLAQSRCDALPTEVVDTQLLIQNSPYVNHYSLRTVFNCSQQVVSGPAKGTSGYDGVSVVVQGTSATSYQFTAGVDGTTLDAVLCTSGQVDTWKVLKFQVASSTSGGFFALFICQADGISLQDYVSVATDSSFFSAETQALSLLAGIPNAGDVFDAYSNCPTPQHCAFIN